MGLLERFYLPNSGTVRIDGHPIEQLDLNWLRNQIALVSQEPILFSNSIKFVYFIHIISYITAKLLLRKKYLEFFQA